MPRTSVRNQIMNIADAIETKLEDLKSEIINGERDKEDLSRLLEILKKVQNSLENET